MQHPPKLFARPWHLVENAEREQPLAFVYFDDEAVRARSTKRMTKDEARRLAAQIVRLPDLLEELKLHRAARDESAESQTPVPIGDRS